MSARLGSRAASSGAASGVRGGAAALARLLLAALAGLAPGCVVIGRSTQGSMPSAEAIAGVRRGDDLARVLARCGAPLEAWRQPDGLLLVYDRRAYDYERVGLDPSRALSFLELTQTASDALSNLRLVIERGALVDERLVILFDPDDRVLAVAYRGPDGRRAP